MEPLLSIVIANYNYGRYLESAIRSVFRQKINEVELIVIDGGSTDESVAVINRYADKLAYWCSEPDRGQSDAFNKGFSHANGKYLTWLNADDVLVEGCLNKVIRELKTHPDCEWFTANFFRCYNDGKVMEVHWGPHFYPRWLQRRNSPVVAFGPATFFARDLWRRSGCVDERFHLAMDTEMWERFIVMGVKQRRINVFVWCFRMHEESKTAEFGEHRLSEEHVRQFQIENDLMHKKTGYCESKLMHVLLLGWRMFDGSLLKRWWLRRNFKNYPVAMLLKNSKENVG